MAVHDEIRPVIGQQHGNLRVFWHLVHPRKVRDECLPFLHGVAVLVDLLDLVQKAAEEVRLPGLSRVELLPEMKIELLLRSPHRRAYLRRDRRRPSRQRVPEVILLRLRVLPVRDAAVDPVPGKDVVDLRIGPSLDGLSRVDS